MIAIHRIVTGRGHNVAMMVSMLRKLACPRLGLVLAFVVVLLLALPGMAQQVAPVIAVLNPTNAPEQSRKPYVVLVSLDGFRYDYVRLHGARHLEAMAKHGVHAEAMVPSFPSLTFPNHYSIVTGLYPEHHGIVDNRFYDPVRGEHFSYIQTKDGAWYGGSPLWVLAEKQGMRAAAFFWPGTDVEIDGTRPSYYLNYDSKIEDEMRVQQVLSWLRLPEAERPHFITLYFSEPDHQGHENGPDGQQTIDAIHHVDAMVGELMDGLKSVHLPVNLIVVSDHGMAAEQGDWINLDTFADLTGFETDGLHLYSSDEALRQKAYLALQGVSDKFTVYRQKDVPAYLHFNDNPRIGDPLIIPNGPYAIRVHVPKDNPAKQPSQGAHGYDPQKMHEMWAIFYATGPAFRQHVKLRPFENVDVFPLIANILGLSAPAVDGRADVFKDAMRKPTQNTVSSAAHVQ